MNPGLESNIKIRINESKQLINKVVELSKNFSDMNKFYD